MRQRQDNLLQQLPQLLAHGGHILYQLLLLDNRQDFQGSSTADRMSLVGLPMRESTSACKECVCNLATDQHTSYWGISTA